MVEVDTTSERVYACLLVHGATVYVRFDNNGQYEAFRALCSYMPSPTLKQVTGYDNSDLLIRPSSVDLILKGVTPNA